MTVVIPCRNERRTLAACLDALAAQDHDAFDVLVVDGGSDDGSLELLRARGIRTLRDPARGPSAARNLGVRHARGEIVAFTDADCIPRFDWLSRLVRPFGAGPGVGGVAGGLRLSRSTLLGRLEDNDARLHYRGFITSNIAYRREALLRVGGFDESLACAEDYDLAWRVIDAGYAIEHEPAAVVLHDPPEVRGPLPGYLAKQFWYAREDVPAHASALMRALRAREEGGSARAITLALEALAGTAWAGAAAVGIATRSPALLALALGGAALSSARKVVENVAQVGEGLEEAPRMAAVETAKRIVRGSGTLAGLARLAWAPPRSTGPRSRAAWGRAREAPAPLA